MTTIFYAGQLFEKSHFSQTKPILFMERTVSSCCSIVIPLSTDTSVLVLFPGTCPTYFELGHVVRTP